MSKNLPQIKKDGLFSKIRRGFLKFFRKAENVKIPIEETLNNSETPKQQDNFLREIRAENKIFQLQNKLKEKQVDISDLTDEELDEMIKLYKQQIEDKKQKLKQYRVRIMKKIKEKPQNGCQRKIKISHFPLK